MAERRREITKIYIVLKKGFKTDNELLTCYCTFDLQLELSLQILCVVPASYYWTHFAALLHSTMIPLIS